jgi:hypothetical protein
MEQGNNMRKLVWAGTAVVVVYAAAVYLTADYAVRHPDSWIGRCTYIAAYVGSKCNPFTGLSAAARPAMTGAAPTVCEGAQEPKPNAAPGQEPAPVAGEEASEPIAVQQQIPFTRQFEPAEDPGVPASEETPEPRFSAGEESEAPAAMGTSEGDKPVCTKCGTCCKDGCAKSCCDWFACFFGIKRCGKCCADKAAVPEAQAPEEGTAPKTESPVTDGNKAGKAEKESDTDRKLRQAFGLECGEVKKPINPDVKVTPVPEGIWSFCEDVITWGNYVPDCQEDPSYHQQYPGCPATGCPYPYSHYPVGTTPIECMPGKTLQPKKPASTTGPKPPKKCGGEIKDRECHPPVDTMEARPSDLEKDPFANGPF